MSPWDDTLTEQLRDDISIDQQHRRRRVLDGRGETGHGAGMPRPAGVPVSLVSVRTRDGVTQVYTADPDNLRIQLQDVSFCGGVGPLGNECRA